MAQRSASERAKAEALTALGDTLKYLTGEPSEKTLLQTRALIEYAERQVLSIEALKQTRRPSRARTETTA